jgi:hypothetical protein
VGLLHARVYRVPCAAVCVVSRKRFPDEAPVFEVINSGEYIGAGEVVEGLGYWNGGFSLDGRFVDRHGIGARIVDNAELIRRPKYDGVHPKEGWIGIHLRFEDIKPLTRAAREMLAIAKAGSR